MVVGWWLWRQLGMSIIFERFLFSIITIPFSATNLLIGWSCIGILAAVCYILTASKFLFPRQLLRLGLIRVKNTVLSRYPLSSFYIFTFQNWYLVICIYRVYGNCQERHVSERPHKQNDRCRGQAIKLLFGFFTADRKFQIPRVFGGCTKFFESNPPIITVSLSSSSSASTSSLDLHWENSCILYWWVFCVCVLDRCRKSGVGWKFGWWIRENMLPERNRVFGEWNKRRKVFPFVVDCNDERKIVWRGGFGARFPTIVGEKTPNKASSIHHGRLMDRHTPAVWGRLRGQFSVLPSATNCNSVCESESDGRTREMKSFQIARGAMVLCCKWQWIVTSGNC